jgi:putative endonuclease
VKAYRGFESLPLRLRRAEALRLCRQIIGDGYGATSPLMCLFKSAGGIRRKKMYYVYSLKCNDGFYIGCTDNLRDRLTRHQKGYVPATKNRLPVILNFYIAVNDKYKAFEFEKYLKTGSGRTFIKKHLTRRDG